MKTILSKVTASLLALGLLLAPIQAMAASPYYYWWQVVDEYGNRFPSQTVTCSVYDLASHGAKVLYFQPSLLPHAGAQTTMPLLSDANSRLHFYSDSNADIRVVCYYARGGAATDLRLSVNTHNVMIDRQGRKVVRFPYVTNATNQATGVWIPQGAVIRDVIVQQTGFNPFVGNAPPDVGDGHLNVGFRGNHAISITHALIDRMHTIGQPEWIRPGFGRVFRAATGGIGGGYDDTGFGVHRGVALAQAPRGAVSGPANHQGSRSSAEVAYLVHVAGGLELSYMTSNTPGMSGHVFVIYESYHVGVSTQPIQ